MRIEPQAHIRVGNYGDTGMYAPRVNVIMPNSPNLIAYLSPAEMLAPLETRRHLNLAIDY